MKDLEINGNTYEGISKIAVPISGGGTAQFKDIDEGGGGDAEVVTGTITLESDKTSTYTVHHSLGKLPDIILVSSDYESYIESGVLPSSTTFLCTIGWFSSLDLKASKSFSTGTNPKFNYYVKELNDTTTEGHIINVTSSSFDIYAKSNRKLLKDLTFTFTCIKL